MAIYDIKVCTVYFCGLGASLKCFTGITIPPQAVNVSINGVAEFTCTAVANSFTWHANGQQLSDRDGVSRTTVAVEEARDIRKSTLKMAVTATDNATNITCTAILLSPLSSDESKPVLLLVQGIVLRLSVLINLGHSHTGLLEPVSNLTVVSINSTTVLISWSPPFTLEGVPILGYNVTITNTTSEENETMSVEGDTTMLYYSIDHPDPDNNFTVTVVPINGAGPGEDDTERFSFSFGELNLYSVYTTIKIDPGAVHTSLVLSSTISMSLSSSLSTSTHVTPSPDVRTIHTTTTTTTTTVCEYIIDCCLWSVFIYYTVYWCVIRRISLIGTYSLLSAYFAAVLNIPALKKALFIRRISRISAYFFPVEV